ncbi:hypothetical protein RICGR_0798 [Rickettsiella grylli]|uniref:Uncharacterized protein n=1 Tax=Rickettsiella grylli TaxID=59196 RepID=A8PMQ4_9COXI|nr:hypothetical protein RICGR_0798 [Rickettsiella grylli]
MLVTIGVILIFQMIYLNLFHAYFEDLQDKHRHYNALTSDNYGKKIKIDC